jgi:hypothetical protein
MLQSGVYSYDMHLGKWNSDQGRMDRDEGMVYRRSIVPYMVRTSMSFWKVPEGTITGIRSSVTSKGQVQAAHQTLMAKHLHCLTPERIVCCTTESQVNHIAMHSNNALARAGICTAHTIQTSTRNTNAQSKHLSKHTCEHTRNVCVCVWWWGGARNRTMSLLCITTQPPKHCVSAGHVHKLLGQSRWNLQVH